jgi:hypothetical protein
LFFLLPNTAHAYIDPATTTYIIQIATAIIVTLSVTFSIVLFRFRMVFSTFLIRIRTRLSGAEKGARTNGASTSDNTWIEDYQYPKNALPGSKQPPDKAFGFTEITKRQIEAQEVSALTGQPDPLPTMSNAYNFESASSAVGSKRDHEAQRSKRSSGPEPQPTTFRARLAAAWNESRSLKLRLLTSALLAAAVSFTFFVFGPLDLVIASQGELGVGVGDVAWLFGLVGLAVFLVLFAAFALLRGKILDVALSIVVTLLLAGYIQGTFLNGELARLTGESIYWAGMTTPMLINAGIWLLVLIVVLLVRYFLTKRFVYAVSIISALIIVMQAVALISEYPSVDKQQMVGVTSKVLTTEGEFEVASKENIIVLLLDEFDMKYAMALEQEEPGYFDDLDGFTEFTNALWVHADTNPSIPEMLTGIPYEWNQDVLEWQTESYPKSKLLNPLTDNDYHVDLYLDGTLTYPPGHAEILEGLTHNIGVAETVLNKKETIRVLTKLSAYRYAPVFLKPFFWMSFVDYAYLTEAVLPEYPEYLTDDVIFNRALRSEGLSIGDFEKSFKFYHMFGPHTPYYTDRFAQPTPDGVSTVTEQLRGSFYSVREYLNQLKDLRLYENSTIIITADHGAPRQVQAIRTAEEVPALFIKPAGSAHTALQKNNAPVTTENLRATILKEAGLPLPDGAVDCFEVSEDAVVERHVLARYGEAGKTIYHVTDWAVVGDAKDWNNWHLAAEWETEFWA